MNIDLVITLKALLTLCACVVWRLSQHLTSSCTAITMTLSDMFNELCEDDVNL